MGDSAKMDVDSFYEHAQEALEEIADEDDGRSRTAAEWLSLLSQKLGTTASDDEDDEDEGDDEEEESSDDDER